MPWPEMFTHATIPLVTILVRMIIYIANADEFYNQFLSSINCYYLFLLSSPDCLVRRFHIHFEEQHHSRGS